MHTSPGRGLLPEVRARMVASCPDVGLELRQVAWSDRTAGLGGSEHRRRLRVAALPQPPYRWVTLAREPRLVALPNDRRLAERASVSMADLLDEPFLALPETPARCANWLALEDRTAHPVRIGAEINDTEETYEAVASGIGICLLAAGNAPIFARGDVRCCPVGTSAPPSWCWRGTSATAHRCSRRSPSCVGRCARARGRGLIHAACG